MDHQLLSERVRTELQWLRVKGPKTLMAVFGVLSLSKLRAADKCPKRGQHRAFSNMTVCTQVVKLVIEVRWQENDLKEYVPSAALRRTKTPCPKRSHIFFATYNERLRTWSRMCSIKGKTSKIIVAINGSHWPYILRILLGHSLQSVNSWCSCEKYGWMSVIECMHSQRNEIKAREGRDALSY